MPWLRSWYPPQSNHHHHRQAFVLGVTAVIFTACTFLSLFVSLPLAVIFILTSWTDSLRTSLTRWWAQWQEVSSSASGSTFGEVSQLFMQVIHHHHHCHHHMISVDIEVVFWCSGDDVQQRTWLQLIFNIVNLLRNWSQSYPTRFKTAPQALGGSVRWGEISKWTFIIRTRQSGAAAESVCIDWKQQQRWRQEDVDRWEQQEMGKAKHPLQVLIFSKLPLAKTVGTSKKDDKYIIKNRETLWCKLWHHFPYEKSCMAFYVGKVP